MWQIMIFRNLLVIFTGIILFCSLIYLSDYFVSRYLKKRKKTDRKRLRDHQTNVTLIYLAVLIVLCILCFFLIKIQIRGAS